MPKNTIVPYFPQHSCPLGNTLELQVWIPTVIITDSAGKPSANTWTVSSDTRLKNSIVDYPTSDALNVINQVKVRKFRWNEDYRAKHQLEDRDFVGFVAVQELSKRFDVALKNCGIGICLTIRMIYCRDKP